MRVLLFEGGTDILFKQVDKKSGSMGLVVRNNAMDATSVHEEITLSKDELRQLVDWITEGLNESKKGVS